MGIFRKIRKNTNYTNYTKKQRNGIIRSIIDTVQNVNISDDKWISATSTFNFCNKDPISDYIDCHIKKKKKSLFFTGSTQNNLNNPSIGYLFERGNSFEYEIIFKLQQKFPSQVTSISSRFSIDNYKKTIEAMFSLVPIIHSASLIDTKNCTYGIPDLLVRSDFLDKITETKYSLPTTLKSSCLPQNLFYIVIDIKFTTLTLKADGEHILNTHFFPSYKSQLYIYDNALKNIQNCSLETSFILGRRSTYTKTKDNTSYTYISNDPFKRLGKIDYTNIDKDVIETTKDALYWIREMREKGESWDYMNPENENMYPNMKKKNKDLFVEMKKEELANQINEITKIWGCGYSKRELALSFGISSYTDKKLSAELLQFKNKNQEIVDRMLEINRQNEDSFILPKELTNITLQKYKNEFYIDLECTNIVLDPSLESLIFLIGIGYIKNNKFTFEYFLSKSPTKEEEERIIRELKEFLNSFSGTKVLYHWTNIEKRMLGKIKNCKYIDLCHEMKREPISIKNCFSYKLKEVYKCLFGKEEKEEKEGIKNGLEASIEASNLYKTNSSFKNIIKYNKKDCEMMFDILNKLRDFYLG